MTVTDTMNAPNCASVTSRYAVAMDHHAPTWSVRAINSTMSTKKVENGNMRSINSKFVISVAAGAAVVAAATAAAGAAAGVAAGAAPEEVPADATAATSVAAVSLLAFLFDIE